MKKRYWVPIAISTLMAIWGYAQAARALTLPEAHLALEASAFNAAFFVDPVKPETAFNWLAQTLETEGPNTCPESTAR